MHETTRGHSVPKEMMLESSLFFVFCAKCEKIIGKKGYRGTSLCLTSIAINSGSEKKQEN